MITIRFATLADAPDILAIYGSYIQETTITFEYEVPTVAEFTDRIRTIQQQLPYLVAETDGRVVGYAYASRHNERMAYQWSANVSVYIHPDSHRQGIARQLYTRLFDLLRQQGYYNVYAGITLPNLKSEGLHLAMGFGLVGVYTNVGYKFGAWHDVAWLQMALRPYELNPSPPISTTELIRKQIISL
jgi:phosphinothricin acetyltransferase